MTLPELLIESVFWILRRQQGTGPSVRMNGRELCRDRVLSGETWSKTVRFPEGLWHGPWLVVELLSDTFVPSEIIKGSVDERKLGVLVRKIGLVR